MPTFDLKSSVSYFCGARTSSDKCHAQDRGKDDRVVARAAATRRHFGQRVPLLVHRLLSLINMDLPRCQSYDPNLSPRGGTDTVTQFASSQSLDALWGIDGITKPLGFSHFPYEIAAPPRSWAENTGRVTFFRSHDKVRNSCLYSTANSISAARGWTPFKLSREKELQADKGNLFYQGGHFAALEQPDLLWQDIVEFVDHVKETRK